MRIITLSGFILVILNFTLITANIYAQEDSNNTTTSIAKTLYFQIEMPDNWVYAVSSESSATKILGFGPANTIAATPVEYYDEYYDLNIMRIALLFQQDADYTIRNAPLDAYVKYAMDRIQGFLVVSHKDVIVAEEPTLQLDLDGIAENEGSKSIHYYLLHNKEPYWVAYAADEDLYEKYLPDFEKMLKSFKWID